MVPARSTFHSFSSGVYFPSVSLHSASTCFWNFSTSATNRPSKSGSVYGSRVLCFRFFLVSSSFSLLRSSAVMTFGMRTFSAPDDNG